MLVIRKQQLAVLGSVLRRDLARRLADHLARVNGDRDLGWDGQTLQEQAYRGLTSGLRFFEAEADLLRYCEITVVQMGGWHGEDHPGRALAMLRPRSVSAATRLANYERWTTRRKVAPRAR